MDYKPHILIVDDSQSMRSLLRAILKDYDISEAIDGRSALGEIVRKLPDLVLLDVMMPGVDGKSVLNILKNNTKTAHIPIILLTALMDACDNLELLAKGADDIITKPCNPHQLISRINYLLQNKEAYDELANVPHVLSVIAGSVEDRIEAFNGHSAKVAGYAELLGQQILSTNSDIHDLKLAASLILIGYTSISDDTLKKTEALLSSDWVVIKKHPVLAAEICSHFSQLSRISQWIRQHHEHFDGTGYPDGLTGSNINIGGRILAIAEAFAALTSDRPYRQAYNKQDALEILREGAGTVWDPDLVSSFCSVVAKK